MGRSWILIFDRFSQPYVDGVNSFIEFAKVHLGEAREIKCPCINCCNFYKQEYDIVKAHLLISGMIVSYTTWLEQGELPEHNNLDESNGENDEDEDEYDELIEDRSGYEKDVIGPLGIPSLPVMEKKSMVQLKSTRSGSSRE
ncbi:unnamed protein product [Camellia sinensis]